MVKEFNNSKLLCSFLKGDKNVKKKRMIKILTLQKKFMFFTLIFITTTIVYAYKNYFDADFDSDKNCKQLDLINKLRSETERCSRRSKGKYII